MVLIAKKIALLGDGGVGKTSILAFNPKYIKTLSVTSTPYNEYDIVEFPGQQAYKFKGLNLSDFYGAIVVYDVTSRISYKNAKKWIENFKENCHHNNAPIILCGNKCDIKHKRFAIDEDIVHIYTSAKERYNIDNLFTL